MFSHDRLFSSECFHMYLLSLGSTFPLRGLPPTGGGHSLPSSLPPSSPTCLPFSYLMSSLLLLLFLISYLCMSSPAHFHFFLLVFLIATHLLILTFPTSKLIFSPISSLCLLISFILYVPRPSVFVQASRTPMSDLAREYRDADSLNCCCKQAVRAKAK